MTVVKPYFNVVKLIYPFIPYNTGGGLMSKKRSIKKLIEAIDKGKIYASLEELRKLKLEEVCSKTLKCATKEEIVKLRVPELGQYVVVIREYKNYYTKPVKVFIANASATQIKSKGKTYTYNFITLRIPSELRGCKATIRVYKLPL